VQQMHESSSAGSSAASTRYQTAQAELAAIGMRVRRSLPTKMLPLSSLEKFNKISYSCSDIPRRPAYSTFDHTREYCEYRFLGIRCLCI
jgi:hypothetical protein